MKRYGLVLLALLMLAWSPQGSGPLQLNPDESPAWLPGPLNQYRLLETDRGLWVAWTGVVRVQFKKTFRQQLDLFLARVNPVAGKIEEVLQVHQQPEAAVAPDLVNHAGKTYVSWLDRGQFRNNPDHRLHIATLEEIRTGQETVPLEYGIQLTPPRLVSTSKGLFALGSSQNRGEKKLRLRIYREAKEGWLPIEGLEETDTSNQDPVLIETSRGLLLFWLRNHKLVFSSSDNGRDWTSPETLSKGWATLVSAVSKGDQVQVVWVEKGVRSSSIYWTESRDDSTWADPVLLKEVPSLQVETQLKDGPGEAVFLLLEYWDGAQEANLIEIGSTSGGDWVFFGLNPHEKRSTVRIHDFLVRDGTAYLLWQRKGRLSQGIFITHAQAPFKDWQESGRVDEPSRRLDLVAPRLTGHAGNLYLTYFAGRRGRVAMQGTSRQGDLLMVPVQADEMPASVQQGEQ